MKCFASSHTDTNTHNCWHFHLATAKCFWNNKTLSLTCDKCKIYFDQVCGDCSEFKANLVEPQRTHFIFIKNHHHQTGRFFKTKTNAWFFCSFSSRRYFIPHQSTLTSIEIEMKKKWEKVSRFLWWAKLYLANSTWNKNLGGCDSIDICYGQMATMMTFDCSYSISSLVTFRLCKCRCNLVLNCFRSIS